jgi:hypothetical protein
LAALAVALLAGLSPLAADTVIHRGIDAFTTTDNGKTFYDFSSNPIPAGFFCKSSAAFTGRMTFKGLPLETGAPGQLHNADTVIERLDDAAFDATGTAVTRIQFRALSLVSIAPIKTGCGSFHVYVTLAGKQRETTMRIHRTEEKGGTFSAPLAVDARLTFIPVRPGRNKSARKLELVGGFTFPASPIPWSTTGRPEAKRIGSVLVDTNGDLTPTPSCSAARTSRRAGRRVSWRKSGAARSVNRRPAISILPPARSTARDRSGPATPTTARSIEVQRGHLGARSRERALCHS